MEYKTISLIPRLSEKAFDLSQKTNTFTFQVPKNASKAAIASAVESQFSVKVAAVHVINQKGKAKRTVRKGGRPVPGRNSDMKKAYVSLVKGDTLPFFLGEADSATTKEGAK